MALVEDDDVVQALSAEGPHQSPRRIALALGARLEWEQIFGQLKEHGWPEDVVEQVRSDRKERITRTYALRVSDAARYFGLSRGGLDKLISAGKLRISTIRSQYRDEKPEKRIPDKDVLALK